jgi:membrane protein
MITKPLILQWEKLIAWIKNNLFKRYICGLYHRIGQHHILLFAGGLAFSFIMCIIPLILIIFSIIGKILALPTIENEISLFAGKLIPYRESAEFIEKIIFNRIAEFEIYRNIAGYLGALGVLFGVSGLFGSMKTILNTIFQFQPDKNPILGKLKDFGMVLFVLLFFLICTTLLPGLEVTIGLWEKIKFLKILQLSAILKFLFSLGSVFIFYSFLFLLYYLVPTKRIPKRAAALSALVATVLWEIAIRLFKYYVSHSHTLGRIYGTYILIVVVAFWIYYSSVIFIVGAEVGDLYREKEIINQ